MDVHGALCEQYHAALDMLQECVELCPPDVWLHGAIQRETWRIALHTAFFTQLYMGQSTESYSAWSDRPSKHEEMWLDPLYAEPYELEPDAEPVSQSEVLAYIAWLHNQVDTVVPGLDLNADSGFSWYARFGKLSHQLMNLRHIQGHVGQLSEILMSEGITTSWIGKGTKAEWSSWEASH